MILHRFGNKINNLFVSCIKGAVPCLPRELTTVLEVVYKQCSHMGRGRDICFNLCPCSLLGGPIFQLGFLCPFILVGDGGTVDNSQSIMNDGCKHSSQYSVDLQPVSVLAVYLINGLFCTVS